MKIEIECCLISNLILIHFQKNKIKKELKKVTLAFANRNRVMSATFIFKNNPTSQNLGSISKKIFDIQDLFIIAKFSSDYQQIEDLFSKTKDSRRDEIETKEKALSLKLRKIVGLF